MPNAFNGHCTSFLVGVDWHPASGMWAGDSVCGSPIVGRQWSAYLFVVAVDVTQAYRKTNSQIGQAMLHVGEQTEDAMCHTLNMPMDFIRVLRWKMQKT